MNTDTAAAAAAAAELQNFLNVLSRGVATGLLATLVYSKLGMLAGPVPVGYT